MSQGHPQLYSVVEASAGYVRPHLKRQKRKTMLWIWAQSSVTEHWFSMPRGKGFDPQCHPKISIYRIEWLKEWGHRLITQQFYGF